VKTSLILCLALACGVLQACDAPGEWSTNEAPRQLRVDFERMTHTATYAPEATQLAPGEQEKLASFLQVAQVTTDDHVYLEPTSNDRHNASRISALARDLTRRGYVVATLPPGRDAVPPNALLVTVERYVVTPPDCPNWTKSPNGDHENAPSSNFGCANLTNLGLMVADPRDLLIGRDMGPESAAHAGLAIQRYREGKTTPLAGPTAGTTYNYNFNASGGTGGSGGAGTGQ
jgi:pilus assembly protein CpaD